MIWKIGVAPALRDLSPPMGSSRFVISRLYAIHIAADEIFKIRDIPALRDLSPPMGSSRFVIFRLYAIYRRRWDLQNS
jgi:hypothetical protein